MSSIAANPVPAPTLLVGMRQSLSFTRNRKPAPARTSNAGAALDAMPSIAASPVAAPSGLMGLRASLSFTRRPVPARTSDAGAAPPAATPAGGAVRMSAAGAAPPAAEIPAGGAARMSVRGAANEVHDSAFDEKAVETVARPRMRARSMSFIRAIRPSDVDPAVSTAAHAAPAGIGADGGIGPRRAHSFVRKPKVPAAVLLSLPPHRVGFVSPVSDKVRQRVAAVSTPGSELRRREIQELLQGKGGGDAAGWLRKAEQIMVSTFSPATDDDDNKLLLHERIFVRAESRALKLPYYQPKAVRREADHISIADVGEGTILDARSLDPKTFEVRLVIQPKGGSGPNLVVDMRCVKRAHYVNLTTLREGSSRERC